MKFWIFLKSLYLIFLLLIWNNHTRSLSYIILNKLLFNLIIIFFRLYNKIFSILPINDLDDLKEKFEERRPGDSFDDFVKEVNDGEEINMI